MMTGDHRAGGLHTGREFSTRFGKLSPGTAILMSTPMGARILMGAAILMGTGTLSIGGTLGEEAVHDLCATRSPGPGRRAKRACGITRGG